MKPWQLIFEAEADKDRNALDPSVRQLVYKAISKVVKNPLPKNEGGYGSPLGNRGGRNLTGLCKIKLLKLGIRVVYELDRENKIMRIIVIAARSDDEVYDIAISRVDL